MRTIMMSGCIIAVVMLHTAIAQAQSATQKEDQTRYTAGFAYRDGSVGSTLALEQHFRVPAGTLFLFARLHGKKSYAFGETTALSGFDGLQTHRFSLQRAVANIGPLALDMGLEAQYHEQPVSIFTHGRTDIRSNVIYGGGALSALAGIGSYRATYFRAGVLGGIAYVEHSLELLIDDTHVRRNRSEVSSGIPRLYGFRFMGGTHFHGIQLDARATEFIVDGVPSTVMKNHQVLTGTISYQTPWYVGVYMSGTRVLGAPHTLFLANSVTFGITGNVTR